MNSSFDFKTPSGDAYSLELSSYDDSSFSIEVYKQIAGHVDVVNISLTRVKGDKPTSVRDLMRLTNFIASLFLVNKNIVICYYCDFLTPIPHTDKRITCQQYRSKLFSLLFERYIHQHHIAGIKEGVITINGVEDYFVHLIYREEHEPYVDAIAADIHEGFDKP